VSLLVVALLAGGAIAYGWWNYEQVERTTLDLAASAPQEPQNFLLIGSDSREDLSPDDPNAAVFTGDGAPPGRRSDSMAIVRVDPTQDRISMLSIPRDLYVPISPSGEQDRINAAFSVSTQSLVDTIQANLQVPINHYVEVDFSGFQDLINTIGGVPIYFDRPVRDRNSGLMVEASGCRVLDGYQGLAFARSRRLEWSDGTEWVDDPSHDIGRMRRQQELSRAAMQQLRSLGLSSVTKVTGLVDAAVDNVTIDDELGVRDLLGLAGHFADFDPGRMQTYSLPVTPFTTSGGAAVELLDVPAAQPMLDVFRGVTTPVVTTTTIPPARPRDVTVAILNGTGTSGEARRVSWVLSGGGFGLGEIADAPEQPERTTVAHAPGGRQMGELVASWLGPAPEIIEDAALAPGQVRILLGPEFNYIDDPSTGDGTTTTTTPQAAPGATPAGPPMVTTTTFPGGWSPTAPPSGVTCS
jgi:LCP family protein required for cell wall assembly